MGGGPRGPGEAAVVAGSGAPELVGAFLSVHGGTGSCRTVVVRWALSPGGAGGGGGSPRVGLALPMAGLEGGSTKVIGWARSRERGMPDEVAPSDVSSHCTVKVRRL